jgi:hypothetical protein
VCDTATPHSVVSAGDQAKSVLCVCVWCVFERVKKQRVLYKSVKGHRKRMEKVWIEMNHPVIDVV